MKGLIAADIIASPYCKEGGSFVENPGFVFFEDYSETVEIRDRHTGRLQNYNFINHSASVTPNSELGLQTVEWLYAHRSEGGQMEDINEYLSGEGNPMVAASVIGASSFDLNMKEKYLSALLEFFDVDELDRRLLEQYHQEEISNLVKELAFEIIHGGSRFSVGDFAFVLVRNGIDPMHPELLNEFRERVFVTAQEGQWNGKTEEVQAFFREQLDEWLNEDMLKEKMNELKENEVERYIRNGYAKNHLLPSECCRMAMDLATMAKDGEKVMDMFAKVESVGWGRGINRPYTVEDLLRSVGDMSFERTLKVASLAFLSSDSYSKAVRSAICLGGDISTAACLAGLFNEAKYGADEKYGLKLQGKGDMREALKEMMDAPKNIPTEVQHTAERIMLESCGIIESDRIVSLFYSENPSFGRNYKSSDYEKTIEEFQSSLSMQEYAKKEQEVAEARRLEFERKARPDWNRVDHSLWHIEVDSRHIIYLNDDYREIVDQEKEKVKINSGYRKADPFFNKDIQFVFTDNAQAYIKAQGLSVDGIDVSNCFLNVSDKNGNQAAVRTDKYGHINGNAFGLVVKKMQQDPKGKWLAKEGQFLDNDKDFALFKDINVHMFERLALNPDKQIQFPSQIALGKAALPERFAEWLKNELEARFSLDCKIEKNNRRGYEGYGLRVFGVRNVRERAVSFGESFKDKIEEAVRKRFGENVEIRSVNDFSSDKKKFEEQMGESLSGTHFVRYHYNVEKLYFYNGALSDVTHTLAPEVNEREYSYKGKPGVYTMSVAMREKILKDWKELQRGCEEMQSELQRQVGYEGGRHIHFATATHIPVIGKNEIVVMDGDLVHARLRLDQTSGKIMKVEESEGLEHYQTNCLRGIPASNVQAVIAALSERVLSGDMDEHVGRNVVANIHFDRSGRLYEKDYKAEQYKIKSLDTDANDFRGVDDRKRESIYYEDYVGNIEKANNDLCQVQDPELMQALGYESGKSRNEESKEESEGEEMVLEVNEF